MVLLFYLVVCSRPLEGSTKCKRDWPGLTFQTGSWCIVECCKLSAKFPIWSGDVRWCSSSSSSMEFQWISSPPISFVPWETVFFSHFSNISAILPLFIPIWLKLTSDCWPCGCLMKLWWVSLSLISIVAWNSVFFRLLSNLSSISHPILFLVYTNSWMNFIAADLDRWLKWSFHHCSHSEKRQNCWV